MNSKDRRKVKRKFKYTVPNRYHPNTEDEKTEWLMREVGMKNFKFVDWKVLGFVYEKDVIFYKLKWA